MSRDSKPVLTQILKVKKHGFRFCFFFLSTGIATILSSGFIVTGQKFSFTHYSFPQINQKSVTCKVFKLGFWFPDPDFPLLSLWDFSPKELTNENQMENKVLLHEYGAKA